jgi:alcohol dehydrogenase (cytochrome c)
MKTRAIVILCTASALLHAQGGPPPPSKVAPVSSVPFERIVNASQEPQNWLTYSGGLSSQRYSELKQITPDNVKNLALKWVFQSR